MSILVIAEHNNASLNPVTHSVIGAALQLQPEVDVLVAGQDCAAAAQAAACAAGVRKVRVADHPAYGHQLAENVALLVQELAGEYQYLLAPSTTTGKNLMPRVAALLDVAQLSDVIAVEGADTFQRPTYAGNVITTVQIEGQPKVLTVRASSFDAVAGDAAAVPLESISSGHDAQLSEFVKEELSVSERPPLDAAEIVVSGGRGLQNGENFQLLERVADKLGAALGASRAAVDAGFVPNDMQVGQTGKVVAPQLYIAVGISGAIQHLAGMKDSKVIVAINKDEDAPIFEIADYGLVADLFEALPKLDELL